MNDQRGMAFVLLAKSPIYRKRGQWREAMAAKSEAIQILQSLNVPIEEMPYPNWLKPWLKFLGKLDAFFNTLKK